MAQVISMSCPDGIAYIDRQVPSCATASEPPPCISTPTHHSIRLSSSSHYRGTPRLPLVRRHMRRDISRSDREDLQQQ
jgi:hypothetical protein